MEGVCYGYYLKSLNDIKIKEQNLSNSVEREVFIDTVYSETTPLFDTHPKNKSLRSNKTISYSTFMNPVYIIKNSSIIQ